MDATADELAGVVDLFGGLTRAELERALAEAAFRADGRSVDEAALAETIDSALASFALVRYDRADEGADGDAESLFIAGPTAFPTLPEHAEDLPHILDVDPRRPDREALGETVCERFAGAADAAIEAGDDDRIHRLIDVSYDVDAWAPVDVTDDRRRLEAALE
ncbi:DUF7109 family protein [Halosolutus gelatinilyticus]|uniref:DUF7109 family protein n=1 Tax=Halosolutus gelatinilyticus TaxID=2931975 RepID=UPI001FF36C72|nr:hypothetical protein [Halosolutus gelatinilyticus]